MTGPGPTAPSMTGQRPLSASSCGGRAHPPRFTPRGLHGGPDSTPVDPDGAYVSVPRDAGRHLAPGLPGLDRTKRVQVQGGWGAQRG